VTTCTAPYRVGYVYIRRMGRTLLVCRECGLPDTDHETTRQAAERLAREMYGEE